MEKLRPMTMLCHVSNQMFVHLMACKHLLHNMAVTLPTSYRFPGGCGGPLTPEKWAVSRLKFLIQISKQTLFLTFNPHTITRSSISDPQLAKLTQLIWNAKQIWISVTTHLSLPQTVFRFPKKTHAWFCLIYLCCFTPSLHSHPTKWGT